MAAALGYRPDDTAARLCFYLQQPSYDTDTLIEVLDQLARFYAGQRVVLIWDGLSAHWSHRMRAYLDSQRDWLCAERLPAYALRQPNPRNSIKRFAPSDDMTGVVPAAWRHETNRLAPQRRGLRDRQAFEPIRLQAGELFTAGRSQAEVAHQLGVARQNVSRWHARWRSGGSEALRSRLMTWIGVSIETRSAREVRSRS
jgi:Homeodomain-like domain